MTKTHDPEDTELASKFTVRDYENARDVADRNAIAEAIRRRFSERYIWPVSTKSRHGFTMMAVSCLMIEALESFRQGWETSERQIKSAFCFFFDTAEPFKDLRGHAQAFYAHVRCGILHQAETTGGWRIRRDRSPLFDSNRLTVNAERFLQNLQQVMNTFCDGLKVAPWGGPEWRNVRNKMNAIAKRCREGVG